MRTVLAMIVVAIWAFAMCYHLERAYGRIDIDQQETIRR